MFRTACHVVMIVMSEHDARRKLFLGPQIRKLRRSLGLTQAAMAAGLDISASYLTLIERNQRPLTAQLILRLADAYDLDIRALSPASDGSTLLALREAAADPLLANADFGDGELQEMAEMFPRIAAAFVRLHEGYRQAREDADALAESAEGASPSGFENSAVEETREALQAHDNYYDELETIAADFHTRAKARTDLPQALTTSLVDHLKSAHNVDTVIMPYDVMGGLLRRFDRHRRRLMLSELLAPSGRTFQVAQLVGQLEAGDLVLAIANDPRLTSDSSRGIYRLTLANYLAGAIMFPYDRVHEAAQRLRYDVEVLASRFAASFEQVAHRLTTLRRPRDRGVPFFMIRVDRAGNISKRFGGGVFPFARSGGTRPPLAPLRGLSHAGTRRGRRRRPSRGPDVHHRRPHGGAPRRRRAHAGSGTRGRPRRRGDARGPPRLRRRPRPLPEGPRHDHLADRRQLPPLPARGLQLARLPPTPLEARRRHQPQVGDTVQVRPVSAQKHAVFR